MHLSERRIYSILAESDSVLCFFSSAATTSAATEREFPRFLAFCFKTRNKPSLTHYCYCDDDVTSAVFKDNS